MKKLKFLVLSALVFLSCSGLQIHSSQAMDSRTISLVQPDGTKRAMKLNPDQPLSELRATLISRGIDILSTDRFESRLGEISPRDEANWQIREAIVNDEILSFKLRRVALQEIPHSAIAGAFCSFESAIPIPPVAQGYEEAYLRFLNGALIYRPNEESNASRIELLIKDLANPLEGTFDLSRCGGDTEKYLSISTGYRKGKKIENAKKVEIWICPWFLIKQEINTTAAHFKSIMDDWNPEKAPVGLFWTDGWWDLSWYDYLTGQSMNELSEGNLCEKQDLRKRHCSDHLYDPDGVLATNFHVSFRVGNF